ncbi:hypothetical protein KAI04_03230 [Candidatus Pacearchaeota archaeon]|nr:hypothetical protein [Candidatus Pacearchaeota archaeon]
MTSKLNIKNKSLIIGGVAVIILIIVLSFFLFNKQSNKSNIEIIEYSDENSTVILTKNSLTKEVSLDMRLYFEEEIIYNDFFGDATELMTEIMCGVASLGFNDTASEDFNNLVEEWNEMEFTVKDEEGEKVEDVEVNENGLEDYELTKAIIEIYIKESDKKISDCIITGYGEDEIEVNYY